MSGGVSWGGLTLTKRDNLLVMGGGGGGWSPEGRPGVSDPVMDVFPLSGISGPLLSWTFVPVLAHAVV